MVQGIATLKQFCHLLYLLSTFKIDIECEDFAIKMLSNSQFVYKTGDILKVVSS